MKKFSQALVWLTFSEIIFNLAGYIIHSFVGRILGPSDYGRFSLIVTLTTMVIVLIGNGIPTAMSKYLSEIFESAPDRIIGIKRKAIMLQVVLILSVTLLFFFGSPLIAQALSDQSLTPLFQISSFIIPSFAAASFYFYYFTGLHFFKLQALLKITRSLGRVVFIVSLVYFFGVKGAISGYIAAPLLVFVVAFLADIFITRRYFPAVKKPITDTVQFSGKTILKYAWPLTLFLLFYQFILTLDLYLVKGLLQNDYLTGIYNAAITVGRIPYYLFYALTIILLPAISQTTTKQDTTETENLVNKSLRLMTLLLFPIITLLIVYAPQTLNLFYGVSYQEAAIPMSILVPGVGFLTVFYVLSFALNGAGLVKIPMKLAFFGLLAVIVLNLILIPPFKLVGAAFSATIAAFLLMISILIYTELHFNVRLRFKTILLSFTSTFLIAYLARFLPNGNFNFIVSGTALFFIYFILLKVFGELKLADIAPLVKLFSKKT